MKHDKLAEDLTQLSFLLSHRGLIRAHSFCSKAAGLLKQTPEPLSESSDYSSVLSKLTESISSLRKCASTAKPGEEKACSSEARSVYRYSVLLSLVSTGRIKELVRARKAGVAAIALGLPTAALFGFPPIGIVLVFLGVLWTYFYFARLRLIGWVTFTTSLLLLTPFLVNAVMYFTHAVTSPEEVENVASELGVSHSVALVVLVALLAVSVTALVLQLYALYKLVKYRVVFE
ncbi:MAG: hypothetical protein ACP5KA_04810 [Desulfurococcaceae archaeon]